MEDKIINYIKDNPNADGIDIAHGLEISIAETYRTLQGLEYQGKIRREYYGISTYYTVLT